MKKEHTGKHKKRRARSALPGMMIHQDGSTHQWIEGTYWDLIVTMDDATNEHYSMFFVEQEGTYSSFKGVKETIEKQGLFCSFYSDRGSHYWLTPEAGGKVDKVNLTQFGRAMKQLGIEMISAYSPEARGRSERAFATHQGRLPQELKKEGSTTTSASVLHDILRKLQPNAQVNLLLQDVNKIKLVAENSKFNLLCLPPDSFPLSDENINQKTFEVSSQKLLKLLNKTKISISNDETRHYLNGIYLHKTNLESKSFLCGVATDSHRLSSSSLEIDPSINIEPIIFIFSCYLIVTLISFPFIDIYNIMNLNIDKKFDLVIFSESFQYVNIQKTLSKVPNFLNKNSYFLICDFFRKPGTGNKLLGGGHAWDEFYNEISSTSFENILDQDITIETARTYDLINKIINNVAEPVRELSAKYLESNYPKIMKLLRWYLDQKIKRINRIYFSGNMTGETFINLKTYRLLLYKL